MPAAGISPVDSSTRLLPLQSVIHVNRISDISSSEDFASETKRETLRDQRWRRRRSVIGAVVCWTAILELTSHAPSILLVLLRLL
jgi:hypothetical protein